MLQSFTTETGAFCYAADYDLPSTYSGYQWKLNQKHDFLLTPFEEFTQQVSSSTALTADVIPFIRALTRLLENTAEMDLGVKTSKATLAMIAPQALMINSGLCSDTFFLFACSQYSF